MKYLTGQYYVEVKGHRYNIHPTKTHNKVENETQTRKNQEVFKNDKDELIIKIYPKRNDQFNINQNLNHRIVVVKKGNFG